MADWLEAGPGFYSKLDDPEPAPHAPYPSWRDTPGGSAREGSQTRAWGRAHSHGGHSFVIRPGSSARGEVITGTAVDWAAGV